MAARKWKVAFLATIAVSLAGSAYAADVYTPPPEEPAYVPPAEAFSWSGLYFGGVVGYGWGTKDVFDTEEPEDDGTYPVSGFLGGVEAGLGMQAGNFYFGVEGDATWANITGNGLIDGDDPIATDINFLATLTGQLGLAWDRVLVYLEGGVAWAHETHTFDTESVSQSQTGWVAGIGAKYALNRNWSVKLEYDYINFGEFEVHFPIPGDEEDVTFNQVLHTVKLGVDYRF
jgi:outer membrane immunogenic protein